MARYRTTIRTPMSQADAFGYMTDLRNFAEWDPGVERVTQVDGSGGGDGATFDVTIDAPGPGLTLRYVTEEYDAPRVAVVRASNGLLTSLDRIEIEPDGTGSIVTYDAELRLAGPLGVFDVALRPVFDRIGRRADRGLQDALDGERI